MSTLNLGLNQHATATLTPKDANGNTATLGGVPVWQHSGIPLDVAVAADGMSAVITSNGTAGAFTIGVSAQSQPFGPLDVQGSFGVVVNSSPAGPAVSFDFAFTTPVDN